MTKDLIADKQGFAGPTFTLSNRLRRSLWGASWILFARWTPPPLHKWRILVLRLFGAKVSYKASVYPDVAIWAPWNLHMDDYATLGRGVICYNIGDIQLGHKAVVSQYVHLCSASHDFRNPDFPLFAKTIEIGANAWVCANAFVGPGVKIGEGAILAAAGVAMSDLAPWGIYRGNPAAFVKERPPVHG